jgi:exosortase
VQLPNCRVVVDDTCSGLRSLISLIALASVLTQWFPVRTPGRRVALIASAVPIAVAANWLRVTVALLVGFVYGAQAAGGAFHDLSGVAVFLVAFVGLVAVARRLSR